MIGLPLGLMDPIGFQRELGEIPDSLHDPVEVLTAARNRKMIRALEESCLCGLSWPISPVTPCLSQGS